MGELSLSIADQLAKSFDKARFFFGEVSDGLAFHYEEVNFADAVNPAIRLESHTLKYSNCPVLKGGEVRDLVAEDFAVHDLGGACCERLARSITVFGLMLLRDD